MPSTLRWVLCWAVTAILSVSTGGLGFAAGDAVTVYYFHSTTRCDSCLEIERLAEELLTREFSLELAAGRLLWLPVNVDLPENAHFVSDFDLAANELVVSRGAAEIGEAYVKLPDVWALAYDPETLQARLLRLVKDVLAQAP